MPPPPDGIPLNPGIGGPTIETTQLLNGRQLQSIQLVFDVAGVTVPAHLGQGLMTESLSVVLASDQVLPLPTGAATEASVAERFGGLKKVAALVVSGSGDNVIHTPAAGKTLTLVWIGMSTSQDNASEVLATVKLGDKVCYVWYLGNPGAFAHWEPIIADNPDDELIVNLSAAGQNVAVNATYKET